MENRAGRMVWVLIAIVVFLAAVALAFYLGMRHEIAIQKSKCSCWDGVNNVCLPIAACE